MSDAQEAAARLLASIDPERPVFDRHHVEAALRTYFDRLHLEPPPMRWFASPRLAGTDSRRFEPAPSYNASRPRIPRFRLRFPRERPAFRIEERLLELEAADRTAFWIDVRREVWSTSSAVLVPEVLRLITEIDEDGWDRRTREHGIRKHEIALASLSEAAAAGLFAFWVRAGVALLVPRPYMKLEDGQLHRWDGGPAVVWPDKTPYYVWRGVHVPAGYGSRPDRLTASRIRQWRNAEVRSVLLERFGTERFLRRIGGEPVAVDAFGRLWRVRALRSARDIALVEVQNSTPEPDGSRRTYVLEVSPQTTTPREALAQSFGFRHEWEYAPLVET